MFIHRRQRLPTPIQCWAVFYAGVSVSTEHTLTGPNVGKCWVIFAGDSQHSFNTVQCILLAGCACTHDTRTQCLLNVGLLSVTPEQHCTSIVGLSQRMSTRRKISTLRLHVSSATQKHGASNPKDGLMLRKWRE